MKLSVKLQPTAEGRSSAEIFRLLASPSPPPYLRCWKGEDGEPNKEKGSDDRENDGEEADGGPLDDNESGQSSRTSRSSTPDPPLAPPSLTPSAADPAEDMDLLTKATPMDISRTPTNPELMQPPEDDDDDGDDGATTTKASVEDDAPLDFSLKRATEDESTDDDRSVTPNGLPPSISQDGPLDLSVPRRRAFKSEAGSRLHAKMAKLEQALAVPSSPWGYNAPKHSPKAAAAASSKSEIVPMWNGKVKSERRDHHKSGQMAKSNRSVAPVNNAVPYNHPMLHKNASPPLDNSKAMEGHRKGGAKNDPYRPAGRQNPWQSQWMSRSSEQTRDVFTCVWCKESFRSLADMTVHMKQSPRCGMAGMQTTIPVTPPTTSTSSSTAGHHHHHHHQQQQQQQSNPALLAHAAAAAAAAKCSTSSSPTSSAANAVIKENVSLPRKLVRGQDVWLGKGAEQTRQILKCMWCGQSFKTLADMTTHMRVTQHYTNIISQEQIISWRTPEDKMAAQSQVNAVLTCKVCDQAFGSLKELSYHMVKNSHYKEHILRSITEGGGRRRQTRERRKKSLPVRKLLELERMELSKQGPSSNPGDVANHAKSEAVDGKISCEECTEKVDAKDFVQHIKSCAQGSRSQHSVKSSPGGSEGAKSDTNSEAPTTSGAPSRTPPRPSSQEPHQNQEEGGGKVASILQQDDSLCDSVESTGSTSVLNAIEKLIEKSFESKGRRNAVSTGILQRLGIDEEVYPPWHPSSSPNAFGVLRSTVDMQRKSTSPLGRLHDFKMEMADFSGSESRSRSSSISEKHPTSFDEHLRLTFGLSAKDVMNRVSTPSSASRSCSPDHFRSDSPVDDRVFAAKEVHSNAVPATPPPPHAGAPAAFSNCSPRARSATPCSDREPSEKGATKDTDLPPKELVNCKVEIDDPDDKEASNEEKPINCSREATPKSEDRRTPVSRSPSCEPDSSKARASPAARAQSPAAAIKSTKSGSSRRKNRSSECHRKSHSSSSNKRKSSSHRRKDSEGGGGNDSAMGSPMSTHSSEVTSPRASKHSDAGDHPLKELQKLLDKTDAHLSRPNLPATPGSILAFSWACSEATTSDSLMKCAFCDTHFISKGAYRHHLSKMHFVKDGSLAEIAAASTWKPPTSASGGGNSHNNKSGSSNGCNSSSAAGNNHNDSSGRLASSPQKDLLQPPVMDESPHSKFLKYTELAKQLSSKYV